MLGEKKSEIYDLIPNQFLPKMKLFNPDEFEKAAQFSDHIGYPVIVKPNIGERGRLVEKITGPDLLKQYISRCPVSFFVQEMVDYPVELGVFYVRYPHENEGRITSIVQKEFLKVTGDGQSTIHELLLATPRASLQVDFNNSRLTDSIKTIPKTGEEVLIEPIGNHCRGTCFLDKRRYIDPELNRSIDQLAKMIPEFFFGRFDLKCVSIEDLKSLKNVKILELNGAGAEPAHIYQPGYPLYRAYQDIFSHLKMLAEISKENHQSGHSYWKFRDGIRKMSEIRSYTRKILFK